MKKHTKLVVLAAAGVLSLVSVSSADTALLNENFDSYTVGSDLDGQSTNPSDPTDLAAVWNGLVRPAGTQIGAVIDGVGADHYAYLANADTNEVATGAWYHHLAVPASDQQIHVSWAGWTVNGALAPTQSFGLSLRVHGDDLNDVVRVYLNQDDAYHAYTMNVNLFDHTAAVSVDGATPTLISLPAGVTSIDELSLFANGGMGTGTSAFGYFDDISASSVPEPAFLSVFGAAGLLLGRRRSR
jgi:hypothetical protein